MKKILSILCSTIMLLLVMSINASAQTDFSWKKYDKGYVTIVFDDGRNCTKDLFELFESYNMPLSCAIIGNSVLNNNNFVTLLKDIQNHGGEILSHTYTHKAFSENTTLDDIEYQFSESYKSLTNAGFVINGVIEAGSGGGETKVDYNLVDQVARKYYKYSDRYGTSLQYKSQRTYMKGKKIEYLQAILNRAAANNEWSILFAHDFSEISSNDLKKLLQFIDTTDNLECVTYKYMYENFGNYSTPVDFGSTYYTVSFLNADGKVFEERVVAAGETIKAIPENPPTNTEWNDETITVNTNIKIKPLETISDSIDSNVTVTNSDEHNSDNEKSYSGNILSIVIISVSSLIVLSIIVAAVFILIINKKK